MSRVVVYLIALFALLGCVKAFAADDAFLISQASVTAAGGFPYKISQPGSYKLTGNLVVPAKTDGIEISAADVTVDLNGFTIIGGSVCDATSQGCLPSPKVKANGIVSREIGATVRNGIVRGFSRAVKGSALVEKIQFIRNISTGVETNDAEVIRSDALRVVGSGNRPYFTR